MSPEPCLPVLSLIARTTGDLAAGVRRVSETWPSFRLVTPRFLFDESDYYAEEMGEPLFRWWGYRRSLENPADLTDWKRTTEEIEDELRDEEGNRTVNVDPGYLDYGLVVLASHKNHHQKIYLGEEVYADPVLEYVDGSYRPFHWTFPDFSDDRYYPVLEDVRSTYKKLRSA